MGQEIERKFLVNKAMWQPEGEGSLYQQGYLSLVPERTVRVRLAGNKAFLTIKGKAEGIRRLEFEYAIPVDDAKELLKLCEGNIISKRRYHVDVAGHVWEVDVFDGDNEGLLVAEIELASEGETFECPDWLAEEVSHDQRYANSQLTQHPYKDWG